MKIRDLLAGRHKDVITIEGHAPVSQAVAEMVAANVGSVLILIDGSIDGIFTERDALRLWFTKEKVHDEPVMRFMTGQLVIVHPEDSLEEAMSVMSQRNIRHLLVVEEEKLLAVLSIKDLVKAYVGTLEASIQQMDKVLL